MVYSMTGYGKCSRIINSREITVEVKSVNHRYFECAIKSPRFTNFLDDRIKRQVNAAISRGKVEVALQIRMVNKADTVVQANVLLAKSYYDALYEISNGLNIPYDVTVMELAGMDGVLTQAKCEEDTEELWQDIQIVLQQSLLEYNEMRRIEGEKLEQDIYYRLDLITKALRVIESTASVRIQKYIDKLTQKMAVILQDQQVDQQRILAEAVIFADRTAIDEETVRLNSHLEQYKLILSQDTSQGRKLDFLTQEVNREVNTIGSKSNDIETIKLVVEIKSEVEKIREQIQNIE